MGKQKCFIITTLIVGIVAALPKDNIVLEDSHKITSKSTDGISNFSSQLPSQSMCGIRKAPNLRIVGGSDSQLGAWPWMVALGYKKVVRNKKDSIGETLKWQCSGTLISNRHVLTAGTCVFNTGTQELTVARLGDLNLDPKVDDGATPLDVPIQRIILHKDYDNLKLTSDIALLVLKNNINFTALIQPICLPQSPSIKNMNMINSLVFVAGWGTTEYKGERSLSLKEIRIPITSIADCIKAYAAEKTEKVVLDDRIICAGETGKDACAGDSGGPLMWFNEKQFYLMGIVSFGSTICGGNHPGVYTRVPYFLDWILEHINN